jgi:hypothetical protein
VRRRRLFKTSRTRVSVRCAKAFLVADAVIALFVVATATVALLATVRHEHSAELNLADSRSALHLAEHALLNLQQGQPMPVVTGESQLKIQPTPDGTAPAGYVWAKVEAVVHGHHRSLFGIVPAGSLPPAEGK